MKYIAKLYGMNVVSLAKSVVDDWKEEHRYYYGTPIGQKRILVGFNYDPVGYSDSSTIIDDSSSFTSSVKCDRWLRNSGNDHRIAFGKDSTDVYVLVGYQGRRHGMRYEFVDLLKMGANKCSVITYVTQEQSWSPWTNAADF